VSAWRSGLQLNAALDSAGASTGLYGNSPSLRSPPQYAGLPNRLGPGRQLRGKPAEAIALHRSGLHQVRGEAIVFQQPRKPPQLNATSNAASVPAGHVQIVSVPFGTLRFASATPFWSTTAT
jgi:hypothetical protein